MLRLLYILLMLLIGFDAQTQERVTVKGQVTDTLTKAPISHCNVHIVGTSYSSITDLNGYYKMLVSRDMDSIIVTATHVNFDTQTRSVRNYKIKNCIIDFCLRASTNTMSEIVIDTSPDTVWGHAHLNVADFAFHDEKLLLLTYAKEERWKRQEDSKITLYAGCKLILLDSNRQEIAYKNLDDLAIGFYTNYFNEIFLQCNGKIFLLSFHNNEISMEAFSIENFQQFIEPIVDTISNIVYYSNYNNYYPAFEYLIFNTIDSTTQILRYFVDEELMQRYRAQYRDLGPRQKLEAFRLELQTGIDKEIHSAFMTGFPASPFYQPLNIPMFVVHDTLLIFDHAHDKLIRYSKLNEALDSAHIEYHKHQKNLKWCELLLQDDITNLIYTWHERAGIVYVTNLNTVSGVAQDVRKFSYKYAEKIKIHNGLAYYIYRPYESSQNRFLYNEKIGCGM